MKKYFILLTMLLLLTGCNSKKEIIYDGDTAGDILMTIDGAYTNTSVTVTIKDNSNKKNAYSKDFGIYKKKNDKWIALETLSKKIATTLELYYVDENNRLKFNLNWEELYGQLPKGEYKIVMHATGEDSKTYYFSTDFEL